VPSDADSLIAYQRQLATSAAVPRIFDHTTSIIGVCWVCSPVVAGQVRRPSSTVFKVRMDDWGSVESSRECHPKAGR
jgi:hypothetical protein